MSGPVYEYLARDHDRLDALLQQCLGAADEIPYEPYDRFRRGILRHIGIEERVLFPLLRAVRGTTPREQQLHKDHAAIAALLVPAPTGVEIRQIHRILSVHNDLEERAEGLYDEVEAAGNDGTTDLIERVVNFPQIPVAPHSDSPLLRSTIEQLLREASGS